MTNNKPPIDLKENEEEYINLTITPPSLEDKIEVYTENGEFNIRIIPNNKESDD